VFRSRDKEVDGASGRPWIAIDAFTLLA